MKRSILLIILFALNAQLAKSQSLQEQNIKERFNPALSVSSVAMRSVRGWKYGLEVGFTTKRDLYIGGFSYSSRPAVESSVEADTFQGLHVSFPLLKMDRWSVLADQKIGFYNQRFFSLLPTMALNYDVNEHVSAAIGAGVSDRLPVFNFKLIFHLKKKF